MIKEMYLLLVAILFLYKIIKIVLFWIMSDKAQKRVSRGLNASRNNTGLADVVKTLLSLKNKGDLNDTP